MEFRMAKEEDRAAVERLWDYCFEKREEPFFQWFFMEYCRLENVLLVHQQEKMNACLHLIPYTLFLRGQSMPVSYIVGLATMPEARGGGAIRQLLKAALEMMRQRGHYISLLMPSKAGFYYPFHWELCYHHYKYKVKLEDLRGISGLHGELRPVKLDADTSALQEVYQVFTADKHGYVIRDASYWQLVGTEHAAEHGYFYILESDGNPEGYIMYHLRDNKIIIREMAYIKIEAQKALLRFLYNHWAQADVMEWNAPLDDLLYLNLPEPKREVQLFPFMTGRVVDVAKVLETAGYQQNISESMTIGITDELAEWNNHVFSLVVAEGKGRVEVLSQTEGAVQCSIGAFSQLFFGRVSASELAKTGRLMTDFPGNIAILDRLFPKCNNFINEYY